MRAGANRRVRLLIGGLVTMVVGAAVGRLFPPFVVDQPFWHDFWSGPPAAGIFALAGAFVAFGAALVGAKVSRLAAHRQEWWDRAEWALRLAMSDEDVARLVGLEALSALSDEATKTEYTMILAVIEAVAGAELDSAMLPTDNETEGGVDL